MYAALWATAPYIARMLGSPDAARMLRILCLCVIVDALCAVPLALLTREFAQGRRMLVDSLNFATATIVMVWLAFAGHGAMSFAWAALAGCTVALVTSMIVARYLVLPGWNTADARRLLRYGLPLAGASLFSLGVVNVDSAIVGATLGPTMLGLYQLAFNISSWPVTTISQAAQRVSFAGFSRVADASTGLADASTGLADAFGQALSLLMVLTVPACVLLAALARPLIQLIYGSRWLASTDSLIFLAGLALLRVTYAIFYNYLAAVGRRTTLLVIELLWLGTLVPVLFAGATVGGITGVSAGHDIVPAAIVGPAFLWALSRARIRPRAVFRACWRPCAGGALMAAAMLLVVRLTGPGAAGLAGAIAAGCAAYLPAVYPLRVLVLGPAGGTADKSPRPRHRAPTRRPTRAAG